MMDEAFVAGRKERALLSHHRGAPIFSMGQEKRQEPMLVGAGPGFPPSHTPSVFNYRPPAQQYGPFHPPFVSGAGKQPLAWRDHSDRASAARGVSNPQWSFYGPHGEGFGERGREGAQLKGTRGSYVAGPAGGIHAIDTVHTGDPGEGIFYGYGIRKPNANPGPGHHNPHPGTTSTPTRRRRPVRSKHSLMVATPTHPNPPARQVPTPASHRSSSSRPGPAPHRRSSARPTARCSPSRWWRTTTNSKNE